MFTGIIETVGLLEEVIRTEDSQRMRFTAPEIMDGTRHGDSVAVNGVCLSVTQPDSHGYWADVMQVTLDYTTLGTLQPGEHVNMERAMASHSRFGGHIVQGHVDGTATLLQRTRSQHWEVFRFSFDNPALARYAAHKGSIAVNGTSLTIAEVSAAQAAEPWFEVSLIPTTLADTMLGQLHVGHTVNIECDVLAKYLERLQQAKAQEK